MKDKNMKQIIIKKLNNTKKKLTMENALKIIRNTTAGEKATGTTTKIPSRVKNCVRVHLPVPRPVAEEADSTTGPS